MRPGNHLAFGSFGLRVITVETWLMAQVSRLAQPAAYSVTNDDISDLGSDTASSSWIYNRIGANLTGLLVVVLALGLWRALSPTCSGGSARPRCWPPAQASCSTASSTSIAEGIDTGCTNDSWHSHVHKIESGVTGAATIAAPLILAFAFRRIPAWRDSWLPSLITVPAIVGPMSSSRRLGTGRPRERERSSRSSGSPSSACACFRAGKPAAT